MVRAGIAVYADGQWTEVALPVAAPKRRAYFMPCQSCQPAGPCAAAGVVLILALGFTTAPIDGQAVKVAVLAIGMTSAMRREHAGTALNEVARDNLKKFSQDRDELRQRTVRRA